MKSFPPTNEDRDFIRQAIKKNGEVEFGGVGDLEMGHGILTGYVICAMQAARLHGAFNGRNNVVRVTRHLDSGFLVAATVTLTDEPIAGQGGF